MPARLPSQIAWRHVGAREGFEAAFVAEVSDGLCFTGTTAALEEGHVWTVSYQVTVDPMSWATRSARVSARTDAGKRFVTTSFQLSLGASVSSSVCSWPSG